MFPKSPEATGERRMSRKRKAPDHTYSLPSSPKALKAKFDASMATIRKMKRQRYNALARERRAKKNMQALLEELKAKNLINEELKDKLECYSGKINNDDEYFVLCSLLDILVTIQRRPIKSLLLM